MTRDEILAALVEGGASYGAPSIVKLEDGRLVRLKVEPDMDHSIFDDGDWFGAVEWEDRRRTNDYGWPLRPEGFDGNAEILHIDGGRMWWQPPADVRRGTDAFRALRSSLLDVLNYGWVGYVVEVCDGDDAYGRPIVTQVAGLWGVESMADGEYVTDIIGDLLNELEVVPVHK